MTEYHNCRLCGVFFDRETHDAGDNPHTIEKEAAYEEHFCPVCLLGARLSKGYSCLDRVLSN